MAAAQLATAPGAADRQKPGETRVTAEMVAGLDDAAGRDRGGDRAAARVRRPGRDAPVGGARAGPDDRPPGRASGRRDPPIRPAPRRPARAVPEPPRRPALDPRPSRRAGRVAGRHTIADPHVEADGSSRRTDRARVAESLPPTRQSGVRSEDAAAGLAAAGRGPIRAHPIRRVGGTRERQLRIRIGWPDRATGRPDGRAALVVDSAVAVLLLDVHGTAADGLRGLPGREQPRAGPVRPQPLDRLRPRRDGPGDRHPGRHPPPQREHGTGPLLRLRRPQRPDLRRDRPGLHGYSTGRRPRSSRRS